MQIAEEEEKYYCRSDLKPSNILICDVVFKIADFGSCFRGRTEFRCTLSYSAPECDIRFQEPSLGSPHDIWSFGGILSEVVAWILGGPREVEGFRIERYVTLVFPSLYHGNTDFGCRRGYVFLGLNSMILAAPFYLYERGKFSISPAVDRRLEAMIKRAVEIFGPSGSKSADQVADLIKACLIIDPYQRLTARVVADRLNEIDRSFEVVEEFDVRVLASQGYE